MCIWLISYFFGLIFLEVSGEKCHKGEKQSPIDIVSREARYQEFRPFTVSGHDKLSIRRGTLTAQNKGDTLKLYTASKSSQAVLGGGPLTVDYEFVEMHFHWGDAVKDMGSEHSIDGQKYPLELHMVHRNVHDETVSEALEHENGLTVLGFKFQYVKESEVASRGMDTLAKIAENFLVDSGSEFSKRDIEKEFKDKEDDVNLINFLPVLMDEYFHYKGSLTTGGCEEAVNWVVFKNPLAIKKKHLKAFQSLKNKEGVKIANNFRPTQPMNTRPIYYHGIQLVKSKAVARGSVGFRSSKLSRTSDYLLPVSSCPTSPHPAIMADKKEQRDADKMWQIKPCMKGKTRMFYFT